MVYNKLPMIIYELGIGDLISTTINIQERLEI